MSQVELERPHKSVQFDYENRYCGDCVLYYSRNDVQNLDDTEGSRGLIMDKNGFTLVEVLVSIVVIGLLSVTVIKEIVGAQDAATTVSCLAELDAFASEVEVLSPEGLAPTQDQVRERIDWEGKFKDYWYIPNNSDFNKGHGNDLDGCDEENPGKSLSGRECIPMRFLIVCMHETHGNNSDAKYSFNVGGGMPPQIVAYNEVRHTYLQDAKWWPRKDPRFDKWIGMSPKK